MDGGESAPVLGRFHHLLKAGFDLASKLPPPFSKMLTDTDPNYKRVFLKSCKGSWEIDVKKCEYGCVHFLGKSWEGYVSDHNLKEGDTIVFEHYGHLRFNTIMFNKMGNEKGSSISEEEESSSEDDVEKEKDSSFSEDEEEEEESSSEDDVEQDSSFSVEEEEESSSEDDVDMDFAFSEEEEEESTHEDDVEERFDEHVQRLDEKDEEQDIDGEDDVPIQGNYGSTADQVANSSQFQITIAKWTLRMGWTHVPKQVSASNDLMQNKTVELRYGTGNSWLAKLEVKNTCKPNKPPGKRAVLTGLIKFWRENKLQIGDKCTFKLAQPSRSSQDQHVVMDVVFERRKRPEPNSEFQFQVTLARWNFTHHYMTVPLSFVKSNDLMLQDRIVKLQNGTGVSWVAKLLVSDTKRANNVVRARSLLTSLFEFMRDNGLKVGDTCIFKLVQPSTSLEHVVMDFVVSRKP